MPKQDQRPLTQAVIAQLNAEIAAHGQSGGSVARALGRDENTFRRYLRGERDLTIEMLWDVLDFLAVDPTQFIARARDRIEKP